MKNRGKSAPKGHFVRVLGQDGATIRWTKRPDGSWRRPEHRRAGWVGELEQAKYVPATVPRPRKRLETGRNASKSRRKGSKKALG